MKKITYLMVVALSLLIANAAQAQNQKGEAVVGLNLGWSITGALIGGVSTEIGVTEDNIDFSRIPPLGITFDYALSDLFSIGAYGNLERFSTTVMDYQYTNSDNELITEDISGSTNRIVFGLRPLVHYGGSEQLDLYSGLRFGLIRWAGSSDSTDPDLNFAESFGLNRFHINLILFGVRYYVTDMVGIGMEIATGAPHIVSLSVNGKFGGESAAPAGRGKSSSRSSGRSSSSRKRR